MKTSISKKIFRTNRYLDLWMNSFLNKPVLNALPPPTLSHLARTKNGAFAFTLAEVLITLLIIGVVAALTIPILMQNHAKQETVSRLQKTFSTLNSAVQMSVVENGPVQNWSYPTVDWDETQSRAWWNTYFVPYSNLSVVKECTYDNRTECWAIDAKYLDGSVGGGLGGYFFWLLKDGSSISFLSLSTEDAQLSVDLNGLKKPNIIGKDIFYFVINKTYGRVRFGGVGRGRTYLLEDHDATCNKSPGTYKGTYCGAVIQIDGWQIKDDYPWN